MPFKNAKDRHRWQRQWLQDRRRKWLSANGPCVRCGSTEDLQVDHIDPRTKVSHRIWSWREESRLAELAKCQVLCRSCHIKKSMECGERRVTTHGTGQMYQHYKCRCALCRAWKSASDKKYRSREWKRRRKN